MIPVDDVSYLMPDFSRHYKLFICGEDTAILRRHTVAVSTHLFVVPVTGSWYIVRPGEVSRGLITVVGEVACYLSEENGKCIIPVRKLVHVDMRGSRVLDIAGALSVAEEHGIGVPTILYNSTTLTTYVAELSSPRYILFYATPTTKKQKSKEEVEDVYNFYEIVSTLVHSDRIKRYMFKLWLID